MDGGRRVLTSWMNFSRQKAAEAGLEGHEVGKGEACGEAGDLEKLVDAVTKGEVGLEVGRGSHGETGALRWWP